MICDQGEDHRIIGMQYGRTGDTPYHYDGVSEYSCQTCGWRVGRFCGNKLNDGEVEPPFCDGSKHPVPVKEPLIGEDDPGG